MVNKNFAQHTVQRMKKAIDASDYRTLNVIVEALDHDQARALVAAMALALFDE